MKRIAIYEHIFESMGSGVKLARMGASDILIQGESGIGKSLLAKFIHDNDRKKWRPRCKSKTLLAIR